MVHVPEHFNNIKTIIFDMDGVITSEEAYWDAAGLTVRELLESPAFLGLSPQDYTPVADIFYTKLAKSSRYEWRKYLSRDLIRIIKKYGINSNWDVAYITFGLYLAPLLSMTLPTIKKLINQSVTSDTLISTTSPQQNQIPEESASEITLYEAVHPISKHIIEEHFGVRFLRAQDFYLWGEYFRNLRWSVTPLQNIDSSGVITFSDEIKGLALLDELNRIIQRNYPHPVKLFGRQTTLWDDCRELFQSWYLGEEIYQKLYNKTLYYGPKPGLIHNEEPLLGRPATIRILKELKNKGYNLAIATGRPKLEILKPLERWDLLKYFDKNRIVTYDDVEESEATLKSKGKLHSLGKPHPFPFLKAMFPEMPDDELVILETSEIPNRHEFLIIGDAQADIWAAKKIGCPCVGLLSGAIGEENRDSLEESNPDLICNDLLEFTDAFLASSINK